MQCIHTHFGFHSMNFSYNAISFCASRFHLSHLPRSSSVCRLHCVACVRSMHTVQLICCFLPMPNLAVEMHQRNIQCLHWLFSLNVSHRSAPHSTQISLPVNIIAICNHLKIEYNTFTHSTHTVGQMAISFFYVFIFFRQTIGIEGCT